MSDSPSIPEREISAVIALKEQEEQLVAEVEAYLQAKYPEESALVKQRFASLRALGVSASQFPSVRESQTVRGEVRDEEMLVESLMDFSPSSRLLHIPTRIVAARSFLVAKCHAFTMLALVVRDTDVFFAPVRRVILSIIYTLVAEEVYFACLEDAAFPARVKRQLANDLIALWDSGTDPRSVHHFPALEALWAARDAAPPSFGTMDGSSELMRVSFDLGKDWDEFLIEQAADNETRWALEEFLFGLSHEEIREVRTRLKRFGILAVGHDEVRSFLGSRPTYTIFKSSEPRAIYDFYIDRRDAAEFRKRTGASGPGKTLEEMYLKFRIAQEG